MFRDLINVCNLCYNPLVLKKKLVKPLKKCFLGPIYTKKGHYRPRPKWKTIFFGRNNKNRSSAFRHFLFYQNIMFWLSYESFSELWILSDVFCQKKCYFQLKQVWIYYRHDNWFIGLYLSYYTQKWKILLIIFWGFLVLSTENYIQLTCLEDNSM